MIALQFGLGGTELFGVALSALVGRLVAFVVGFLLVWLLGRLVLIPLVLRLLEARGFTQALRGLTKSLANLLVVFAAVAVAFMAAGFPSFLTAAATLSGALALALGFAAQDLIGNFVAGVFIIKDEPFNVGDWIEWNDNAGRVEAIDLRVSRVGRSTTSRLPSRTVSSPTTPSPTPSPTTNCARSSSSESATRTTSGRLVRPSSRR